MRVDHRRLNVRVTHPRLQGPQRYACGCGCAPGTEGMAEVVETDLAYVRPLESALEPLAHLAALEGMTGGRVLPVAEERRPFKRPPPSSHPGGDGVAQWLPDRSGDATRDQVAGASGWTIQRTAKPRR
jgi:hypothetical protein